MSCCSARAGRGKGGGKDGEGVFCLGGAPFWKVFGKGLGAGGAIAFSLWGGALGKEGKTPLGRNFGGGAIRVVSLGVTTALVTVSASNLRNVRKEF